MILFSRCFRFVCVCIVFLGGMAYALPNASIHGTVTDPTGAAVTNAKVELLETRNDTETALVTVMTDAHGQYVLEQTSGAGLSLRVSSPGLGTVEKLLLIENGLHDFLLNISLPLASFSEQITVTSTGTPTPQSQVGAAVTTLSEPDFQGTRDIYEALRFVPGLQAVQTGQAGGTTSLFIRGGDSDANKLLIDGIPANDIGGVVEFANLASAPVGEVEVLRGPNSVLYGSDALAGVVSLTTPRGTTPLPLISYLIDGGNFGSYQQEGAFSGLYRRLDYFSDFSRFDTSNSIPDNTFHNGTFAGNYGLRLSGNSSLRATVHHDQVASGQPNAIDLYVFPTLAKQANEDSYFGATWEDETTPNWHNLVRYGGIRLRSNYTQFAASGIPQYIDYTNPSGPVYNCNPASDPNCFLSDYLGEPVTLRGANGYAVSGQAVYQYPESYPNSSPTSTDKDFVYAQSDYRFTPHLLGLFGFRYEDERGNSENLDGTLISIERGNYSYTLQLQGDIGNRFFYTLGGGLEDNGLFGFAGTPRVSLAWQAIRGNTGGFLDGTKLRASFGEGIKEPAVFDQLSSLYALLQSVSGGNSLISQYHIGPIGPQRSRSYDAGVDQMFLNRRGRASLTLFHNEFSDGIEYIPQQGLVDLGIPSAVAAPAVYGATVNSQAYLAQGVETEFEYQITNNIFARAGYTYLDARIQQSFTSDAIGPSFNPNFPAIPIGVFSPLIGARPFRRAPHTGYFELSYRRKRFFTDLRGTLVGRRDDSDFLEFDANGASTLLLPNRNLDPGYQRIDLQASYQMNRYMATEASFSNLLCQHYSEGFGYPSLPFLFRLGMKFTLGGESWPGK